MSDVNVSLTEINDSEILKIEKAITALNAKQGKHVMLESFRREAIERFAEQGFKVKVQAWETDQPGLYAFDIDIVDRLEGEFDPEQMVYEAVNDVLDLGEGGVIKG